VSTIGIFDSGVGGLTVLQALRHALPNADYLYLGDTARLPYGSKSASTVTRYALNAAAHLVRHRVDLLVVACNTASAVALPDVSAFAPVPVVGVIEPGARAALAARPNRIAVIGTEGTIRSGAYQAAIHRLAPQTTVDAAACPLFVPLAEEGWVNHPVTDQVAEIYLRPLLDRGVETLILGCTHYPLLIPAIARVAGTGVRLVDSATAVARTIVEANPSLAAADGNGNVTLHLTDANDRFRRIARTILGADPEHLELVDL
jgi:glutamate racemase